MKGERDARRLVRWCREYRFDLIAIICVPYLFFVNRFWFLSDDAYISFRYARNLAQGYGLRFNPGEQPPVEGFSNFLWVIIAAVFERIGLASPVWMPLLSVICGVILLALVFDRIRRSIGGGTFAACAATTTLAVFPPFTMWSSSGLETMAFSLLLFLTFDRLFLTRPDFSVAWFVIFAVLTILVRSEGFAWVGVLFVLSAGLGLLSRITAPFPHPRFKSILLSGLLISLFAALFAAARFLYFHDFWPNTTYAKMGLPTSYIERGFFYVASFVLTFLTPVVLVLLSFFGLRRRRLNWGPVAVALAWAFPAYAVVTTGDFMAMGRFLVPGLPYAALLLGSTIADLETAKIRSRKFLTGSVLVVMIVGALPGFNIHIVPEEARRRFDFRMTSGRFFSEYEYWQYQKRVGTVRGVMGRWLKEYASTHLKPNATLACGAIGSIAYYSEMIIIDTSGLINRDLARRPVDSGRPRERPGHDKAVPEIEVLSLRPTILGVTAVRSTNPAGVRWDLDHGQMVIPGFSLELQMKERYAPQIFRLDREFGANEDMYIVFWQRID